ncbi:MAG: 50S ribosomal protein L23 [Methylococcales bacterium]
MTEFQLAKVIQGPVISEKSTVVAEQSNQFVFKVIKQSTKKQIKDAVEKMFNVEVDSVRILNVKGKEKRFGGSIGHRSDWKKAYVKLKVGHDIDFSVA